MRYDLFQTIQPFFPDWLERRRQVEDCRPQSDYTRVAILLAARLLFVVRQGSRNALHTKRAEKKFQRHYERLCK